MSHKELSRHGRARTAKTCTKTHAARAKSVVLVDVAVVVLPVFINVCKRLGIRLYVFSINACESEYPQTIKKSLIIHKPIVLLNDR